MELVHYKCLKVNAIIAYFGARELVELRYTLLVRCDLVP